MGQNYIVLCKIRRGSFEVTDNPQNPVLGRDQMACHT
jgi:hypothetical protein